MKKTDVQRLVITALLLALGMVLPFLTGQIPEFGSMLLPLHLPALLCGFLCGWQYGLALGFVLPLLRSFVFGMPPLVPVALTMAFELAAYGAFAGVLYARLSHRPMGVYAALIGAMLLGRVVWGVASWAIYGLLTPNAFMLPMFWLGGFVNAWPGILLQLALVPVLVMSLTKAHLAPTAARTAS